MNATNTTVIQLNGGGSLRLESDLWVLDKRINNRRHRISSGSADLAEALARFRRMFEGQMQVTVFSRWQDYLAKYRQALKNAQKRQIEFTLTEQEYVEIVRRAGGRCEVTGVRFQLDQHLAGCKRQPFAPSLDRIDSSDDYSKDNVRLVCLIANYAMMEWGVEPLKELVLGMIAAGSINVRDAIASTKQRPNRALLASISEIEKTLSSKTTT